MHFVGIAQSLIFNSGTALHIKLYIIWIFYWLMWLLFSCYLTYMVKLQFNPTANLFCICMYTADFGKRITHIYINWSYFKFIVSNIRWVHFLKIYFHWGWWYLLPSFQTFYTSPYPFSTMTLLLFLWENRNNHILHNCFYNPLCRSIHLFFFLLSLGMRS